MKRRAKLGFLCLFLSSAILKPLCQNVSAEGKSQASFPVPVKRDGKWGYEDSRGNIVIAPQFEAAHRFFEGLAAVCVTTSKPSKVTLNGSAGQLRVVPQSLEKWGFIDATGNLVIAPEFADVRDFSEGLAAVTRKILFGDQDTWGYINKHGVMVIKAQFSEAEAFSEGLAFMTAGGVRLTDPIVKSFVKMGSVSVSN